jgi:hypothetical protein
MYYHLLPIQILFIFIVVIVWFPFFLQVGRSCASKEFELHDFKLAHTELKRILPETADLEGEPASEDPIECNNVFTNVLIVILSDFVR